MAKKNRSDRKSKRDAVGAFLNYLISSPGGSGPKKPLVLKKKRKPRFRTAVRS